MLCLSHPRCLGLWWVGYSCLMPTGVTRSRLFLDRLLASLCGLPPRSLRHLYVLAPTWVACCCPSDISADVALSMTWVVHRIAALPLRSPLKLDCQGLPSYVLFPMAAGVRRPSPWHIYQGTDYLISLLRILILKASTRFKFLPLRSLLTLRSTSSWADAGTHISTGQRPTRQQRKRKKYRWWRPGRARPQPRFRRNLQFWN